MIVNLKTIFTLSLSIALGSNSLQAQNKENTLFTAGFANAFIGGLYDGFYPFSQLKQHGNFGLGAPDKLDGELLVLDGKIYQTQHTGKTFEIKDAALTPFSVVNFFKADKRVLVKNGTSKTQLYKLIDSLVSNPNAILALHIKGKFKSVKTRAFPPVEAKPYTPLAQMLDKQQFFTYQNISGDFVGYNIPAYMEGANISGYHFHFINEAKNSGGHVIDFLTDNVILEIDYLNSFAVQVPETEDFKKFDFSKDRSAEVRSVENGKKE